MICEHDFAITEKADKVKQALAAFEEQLSNKDTLIEAGCSMMKHVNGCGSHKLSVLFTRRPG